MNEDKEKDEETIRTVKFVSKKSEEYQTYYVNGAIGIYNPRGDVEFDLFFEHGDLPQEEIMTVEEGNLVPKVSDGNTEAKMIRDIKVGIIMTPAQAENLGKWLSKLANIVVPNVKTDVQQVKTDVQQVKTDVQQ